MTTPPIVINSNLPFDTPQTEPNFCKNWNPNDTTQVGCICYNRTIECHSGIHDLSRFKDHRKRKTHQLVICGLLNVTFDPNILEKFPKLRSVHFEYGMLANWSANFPKLNHLQVGNPNQTLAYRSFKL